MATVSEIPLRQPEDVYRQYLEQRGIPYSDLQERACREVFKIHRHFTLPDLADRLGGEVAEDTLRPMLMHMIRSGLIRKVTLDESPDAFYEHVWGHAHHDHLVCVECGTITEFVSDAIEREQEVVAARHGYEIVRHSMRIEGLCPACREVADCRERIAPPSVAPGATLPLTMIPSGRRVVIADLACGKDSTCRLIAMGLAEGDEIDVLQNTFAGPITIRHHNQTRLAIGQGLAHKIIVRPLERRSKPRTEVREDPS